jgi:hypothetical protein
VTRYLRAANECCGDEQKESNEMRLFCSIVAGLLLGLNIVAAQALQSKGKPTELVATQYEKFIANGAFLTPEGWKRARTIFEESHAFPPDGEISLMATGGALGEDWVKDNEAQVETKWTDYLGTIDSALRFKPPKRDVPIVMTTFVFRLVYTNKHRDIGADGKTIREIIGPWEWKMGEPLILRWATPDRAIEYVSIMRDKTDDPVIRKNADKTIAALKRMGKPCGNASAC